MLKASIYVFLGDLGKYTYLEIDHQSDASQITMIQEQPAQSSTP